MGDNAIWCLEAAWDQFDPCAVPLGSDRCLLILALASRFLYAAPRSEEAEHVQHRMASQWRCSGDRD
jgi:hypothetical protein